MPLFVTPGVDWQSTTRSPTSTAFSLLLPTLLVPFLRSLVTLLLLLLSPRTPPCRDPATSYCVAWPSRIFLQLSLLSQCLSYGDLSFQILKSRVQTSYWYFTYIIFPMCLQLVCLSWTSQLWVLIASMLCPSPSYIWQKRQKKVGFSADNKTRKSQKAPSLIYSCQNRAFAEQYHMTVS